MSNAPAVLVLDDGELRPLRAALSMMGVDVVHLSGDKIPASLEAPRDLLVTSWLHAQSLPELERPEGAFYEPVWICVHDRDFQPLREPLRKLGADFLVHAGIDLVALRLLLSQLLYRGAERRGALRLPLDYPVRYRVRGGLSRATLVDLSREGARLIVGDEVLPGTPLKIYLAPEESSHARVEIRAVALRCTGCGQGTDPYRQSLVVEFPSLQPEARALIEGILQGRHAASCVTPLDPDSSLGGGADRERRRSRRGTYGERLTAFTTVDSEVQQVVLGHDLSVEGIRIGPRPGLSVGDRVELVLYGGPSGEAFTLQAHVVHDAGSGGLGLRFSNLGSDGVRRLEYLVQQLPPVEALTPGAPGDGGLVVSRILVENS